MNSLQQRIRSFLPFGQTVLYTRTEEEIVQHAKEKARDNIILFADQLGISCDLEEDGFPTQAMKDQVASGLTSKSDDPITICEVRWGIVSDAWSMEQWAEALQEFMGNWSFEEMGEGLDLIFGRPGLTINLISVFLHNHNLLRHPLRLSVASAINLARKNDPRLGQVGQLIKDVAGEGDEIDLGTI